MMRRSFLWGSVAVVLAIYSGLLAYSATRHSPTSLEPSLLVAGLSHWKYGRFDLYRVNPPLVRMVGALPVMAVGYEYDWTEPASAPGDRPEFEMGARFIACNAKRSLWLLTLARWACVPLGVLGGLAAFLYSRDLWQSDAAGLLTLTVWCFEPNLLAHGELITNDLACASLGLGATWFFWRWLRSPTWQWAFAAGITLGLAQLAKSSWIVLFALWPILSGFWWLTRPKPISQSGTSESVSADEVWGALRRIAIPNQLLQLIAILATGLYVLNLAYLFDGSLTRLKDYEFVSASLAGATESGSPGNRFRHSWLGHVAVPLPRQYVLGLDTQKRDFESWFRPNYLGGEWRKQGWWYYYLYGMWVKVPHGVQLLAIMAVLALLPWRFRRREGGTAGGHPVSESKVSLRDLLILLVPGLALLVLVSLQTGMNEHFRYVLPTLAILTVFLGGAVYWPKPLRSGLLLATVLWTISGTLMAYPHHLAYCNEFSGGLGNCDAHLLGSSVDWGQDVLLAVEKFDGRGDDVVFLMPSAGNVPHTLYGEIPPGSRGLRYIVSRQFQRMASDKRWAGDGQVRAFRTLCDGVDRGAVRKTPLTPTCDGYTVVEAGGVAARP